MEEFIDSIDEFFNSILGVIDSIFQAIFGEVE